MLRIKSRATRLLTTRDRLAGITIMWPSGHNYGMWLGQPIYDTLRSAVMDDNPKSLKKSIANVDPMLNQRLSGPCDVPRRLDYTMLSIEIYLSYVSVCEFYLVVLRKSSCICFIMYYVYERTYNHQRLNKHTND